MSKIYLVTISIFTDDNGTKEKIKNDFEELLTGKLSWGHIEVKEAKIVVAD
ncbi:hypothetical protein [Moorella sp. E306M]|uniref:hypothetical protein n=1 Tax=Moorella sp. E306M TaxID=2572683 RepID=UPI0010FFB731|nr:hypothetical protein [Moorella sp. E306M]GEA17760.1 hypothetical protein E306M_08940 [Moorella sp. E306M]GEA17829.1 hypothetical protein E306M_09630 [Moorella sp. E306M]